VIDELEAQKTKLLATSSY